MGKVKNLIWDEIEHDTEEPVQLHPECCPRWFHDDAIRAVPTPDQIHEAHLAKLDAWTAWAASDEDCSGELWADYQCAIELHADMEFRRNQAALIDSPIRLLEAE